MTGLEPMVVGYLVSWFENKIGETPDADVDRLGQVVSAKLGNDSALAQLEQDTAVGVHDERTRQRVQLAVEAAAGQDPVFADQLLAAMENIRSSGTAWPWPVT